ncbi:MAG: LuxR C-terminal-related transcriptional regulator, partial [Olsenella sp.]
MGVTGFFAPTLVLAIGILLVAWDRTGGWAARGRNALVAHLLCLVFSVAFIVFELACLYLRGVLSEWNYISVTPWMRCLELGWGTLCLLLLMLAVLLSPSSGTSRHLVAHSCQISTSVLVLGLASGFALALSSMDATTGGTVPKDARVVIVVAVMLCRFLWMIMATLLVPSPLSESLEGRWLPWGSLLAGHALGAVVRMLTEGTQAGFIYVGPAYHLTLLAASLALLVIALVVGRRASRRGAQPRTDREAARPQLPFAPHVYEKMLVGLAGADSLSGRERQVILMTLSGWPASAIAGTLHVSEPTVSSYRGRAYRKLKVKSLPELVARVRPLHRVAPIASSGQPLASGTRRVAALALVPCATLVVSLCLGDRGVTVFSLVTCAMMATGVFSLHRARGTAGRDAHGAGTRDAEARGAEAAIALGSLCTLAGTRALGNSPAGPASVLAGYLVLGTVGALVPLAARGGRDAALSDAMLACDERPRLYLLGRGLTQLEASVSVLTAEGVPAPGIASHLHVALPTVYSYRARGLGKLGLHGRGQL